MFSRVLKNEICGIWHVLWKDRNPLSTARLIVFFALVVFSTLFTVLLNAPGWACADTGSQYIQVCGEQYSANHPPLLARAWYYLNIVCVGPLGIFALNTLLYHAGFALVLVFLRIPLILQVLLYFFASFFPPIYGIAGVVWKDVPAIAGGVLAIGFILAYIATRRLWLIPLIGFSVLISMFSRHNAFSIFPGILMLLFWGIRREKERKIISFLKFGTLSCVLSVGGALFCANVNDRIALPNKTAIYNFIYDIVGISNYSGTFEYADDIRFALTRPLNSQSVRDYYSKRSLLPLTVGVPEKKLPGLIKHPINHTPEQSRVLPKVWVKSILHHPFAYLKHRWGLYSECIGWTENQLWGAFVVQQYDAPGYFDFPMQRSLLRAWWYELARKMIKFDLPQVSRFDTLLYRAWLFIGANFLFLAIGVVFLLKRGSFSLCALSLSSIGLQAMNFVVLPSCDFRYNAWTFVSVVLSVCFLVSLLFNHARKDTDAVSGNEAVPSEIAAASRPLQQVHKTYFQNIILCCIYSVAFILPVAVLCFLLESVRPKEVSDLNRSHIDLVADYPADPRFNIRFNAESSINAEIPLGFELRLDTTKLPVALKKKLEYKWIISRKNDNLGWCPVNPYAPVLAPFPLDQPGYVGIHVFFQDKNSKEEKSFWIGGINVIIPARKP